jgi:glyceraldehyde-3-phosphate dehydrogenase type I
MSTVHAYTNDQMILDLVHKKDQRRGRAANLSIIPTSTGAAKAIFEVIQGLEGKIDGVALRVPVADASLVDLIVELEKDVTKDEVNKAFKDSAKGYMKDIIEYTEDPIVSVDVIGNPHSAVFDSLATMVLGEKSNFIKVFSWYDNEWGYSTRLVDLCNFIANKGIK